MGLSEHFRTTPAFFLLHDFSVSNLKVTLKNQNPRTKKNIKVRHFEKSRPLLHNPPLACDKLAAKSRLPAVTV